MTTSFRRVYASLLGDGLRLPSKPVLVGSDPGRRNGPVEAVFNDTRSSSAEGAWAPYVPGKEGPWNLRRVVPLHRRAGLGATWDEIQRDLADGPGASVDRLLAGRRVQGVPKDFEATASAVAGAAIASREAGRLKAWWVYRMLFGPDPLGERLTLLWH